MSKLFFILKRYGVLGLLWIPIILGIPSLSSSYEVKWDVLSQAGGSGSSANFCLLDSSGQTAIGKGTNSAFTLLDGYILSKTPSPEVGSLTITSTPSNARIYLDGGDTGSMTNRTFTNISAGTHTIKLTLSNYKDWYGTATVTANLTTYVYATLTQTSFGTVTVYDANGNFIGTYTTIQAGVNACPVGGTVSVSAGTYNEAVSINKRIALVGVGTTTITSSVLSLATTVTFDGNNADGASISGFTITGIYNGWANGILCQNGADPIITNNTIIIESTDGKGQGINIASSSPIITNNTIIGKGAGGYGIVCHSSSSNPNIYNNIITAGKYGIYRNAGNLSINYNNVWNNSYGNYYNCTAGAKKISANPQFIGAGDYHLQSTSSCINKGTNTAPAIPSTDKDGNPRIVNGIVDMGAYEFQGTLLTRAVTILPDKPIITAGSTRPIRVEVKGTPSASSPQPVSGETVQFYSRAYLGDGRKNIGQGNLTRHWAITDSTSIARVDFGSLEPGNFEIWAVLGTGFGGTSTVIEVIPEPVQARATGFSSNGLVQSQSTGSEPWYLLCDREYNHYGSWSFTGINPSGGTSGTLTAKLKLLVSGPNQEQGRSTWVDLQIIGSATSATITHRVYLLNLSRPILDASRAAGSPQKAGTESQRTVPVEEGTVPVEVKETGMPYGYGALASVDFPANWLNQGAGTVIIRRVSPNLEKVSVAKSGLAIEGVTSPFMVNVTAKDKEITTDSLTEVTAKVTNPSGSATAGMEVWFNTSVPLGDGISNMGTGTYAWRKVITDSQGAARVYFGSRREGEVRISATAYTGTSSDTAWTTVKVVQAPPPFKAEGFATNAVQSPEYPGWYLMSAYTHIATWTFTNVVPMGTEVTVKLKLPVVSEKMQAGWSTYAKVMVRNGSETVYLLNLTSPPDLALQSGVTGDDIWAISSLKISRNCVDKSNNLTVTVQGFSPNREPFGVAKEAVTLEGVYLNPKIKVWAEPAYVPIGIKSTPVYAVVLSDNGGPISGATVSFTVISGTATGYLIASSSVTNEKGLAQVYFGPQKVGVAEIRGGTVIKNATISDIARVVVMPAIVIETEKATITTRSTVKLTATVITGTSIQGATAGTSDVTRQGIPIIFGANTELGNGITNLGAGSLTSRLVLTDSQGKASVYFSSKVAGRYTISASVGLNPAGDNTTGGQGDTTNSGVIGIREAAATTVEVIWAGSQVKASAFEQNIHNIPLPTGTISSGISLRWFWMNDPAYQHVGTWTFTGLVNPDPTGAGTVRAKLNFLVKRPYLTTETESPVNETGGVIAGTNLKAKAKSIACVQETVATEIEQEISSEDYGRPGFSTEVRVTIMGSGSISATNTYLLNLTAATDQSVWDATGYCGLETVGSIDLPANLINDSTLKIRVQRIASNQEWVGINQSALTLEGVSVTAAPEIKMEVENGTITTGSTIWVRAKVTCGTQSVPAQNVLVHFKADVPLANGQTNLGHGMLTKHEDTTNAEGIAKVDFGSLKPGEVTLIAYIEQAGIVLADRIKVNIVPAPSQMIGRFETNAKSINETMGERWYWLNNYQECGTWTFTNVLPANGSTTLAKFRMLVTNAQGRSGLSTQIRVTINGSESKGNVYLLNLNSLEDNYSGDRPGYHTIASLKLNKEGTVTIRVERRSPDDNTQELPYVGINREALTLEGVMDIPHIVVKADKNQLTTGETTRITAIVYKGTQTIEGVKVKFDMVGEGRMNLGQGVFTRHHDQTNLDGMASVHFGSLDVGQVVIEASCEVEGQTIGGAVPVRIINAPPQVGATGFYTNGQKENDWYWLTNGSAGGQEQIGEWLFTNIQPLIGAKYLTAKLGFLVTNSYGAPGISTRVKVTFLDPVSKEILGSVTVDTGVGTETQIQEATANPYLLNLNTSDILCNSSQGFGYQTISSIDLPVAFAKDGTLLIRVERAGMNIPETGIADAQALQPRVGINKPSMVLEGVYQPVRIEVIPEQEVIYTGDTVRVRAHLINEDSSLRQGTYTINFDSLTALGQGETNLGIGSRTQRSVITNNGVAQVYFGSIKEGKVTIVAWTTLSGMRIFGAAQVTVLPHPAQVEADRFECNGTPTGSGYWFGHQPWHSATWTFTHLRPETNAKFITAKFGLWVTDSEFQPGQTRPKPGYSTNVLVSVIGDKIGSQATYLLNLTSAGQSETQLSGVSAQGYTTIASLKIPASMIKDGTLTIRVGHLPGNQECVFAQREGVKLEGVAMIKEALWLRNPKTGGNVVEMGGKLGVWLESTDPAGTKTVKVFSASDVNGVVLNLVKWDIDNATIAGQDMAANLFFGLLHIGYGSSTSAGYMGTLSARPGDVIIATYPVGTPSPSLRAEAYVEKGLAKIVGWVSSKNGSISDALVFAKPKNPQDTSSPVVRTDAKGNYVMENILPGSYEMMAVKEGYKPDIKTDIWVEPGITTLVNFLLAPMLRQGTITGQLTPKGNIPLIVYDETTGKMITYPRIVLSRPVGLEQAGNPIDPEKDLKLDETTGKVTYWIRAVPEGTYTIEVMASGYQPTQTIGVGVEANQTSEANFILLPIATGQIKGVAINEASYPIAGIPVEAINSQGVSVLRTTTDINGLYTMKHLLPGSYQILAGGTDLGYMPATKVAKVLPDQITSGINFILKSGSIIAVKVKEKGTSTPISGAKVTARIPNSPLPAVVGYTDNRGEVVLRGLLPSLGYSVRVEAKDYLPEAKHNVTPSPTTKLHFELNSALSSIMGTVTASGIAVPNAVVNIYSLSFSDTSMTDDAGRFGQVTVGPGKYVVEVIKAGYKMRTELITVGEGVTVGLELNLESGGSISGYITDTAGNPVAKAGVIAIRLPGHEGDGVALTNENGYYLIPGLEYQGTVTYLVVVVINKGAGVFIGGKVTLSESEKNKSLDIQLSSVCPQFYLDSLFDGTKLQATVYSTKPLQANPGVSHNGAGSLGLVEKEQERIYRFEYTPATTGESVTFTIEGTDQDGNTGSYTYTHNFGGGGVSPARPYGAMPLKAGLSAGKDLEAKELLIGLNTSDAAQMILEDMAMVTIPVPKNTLKNIYLGTGTVPEGSKTTKLRMKKVDRGNSSPIGKTKRRSQDYDISLVNGQLTGTVTVSIPYGTLTSSVNQINVYKSEGGATWTMITESRTVDTVNRLLSVNVSSFSVFMVAEDNSTPTLTLGTVTPSLGTSGQTFTYGVTYTDTDNDPPVYLKLFIDDKEVEMSKGAGSYTTGQGYTYSTSTLKPGIHSYCFKACDGITGTISTSSYQGPTLFASVNTPSKLGKVVVYPNPFRSEGHTKITFGGKELETKLTSEATIKIYDIAGELVDKIEVKNGDGDVEWVVPAKIASGIYIYLITNSQGDKVIGKLGIIR